ncbi:MAG: dihydrofolate reductase family protein, partial [bacterium]
SSDAEDATPVSYASKRKYKLRLISSDAEDATPVSYASKRKYKLRLLGVHEDHEDDENAEIGVQQQYRKVFPNLRALLDHLSSEKKTRIMVEAGPNLMKSFLREGLVDEIIHYEPLDIQVGNYDTSLNGNDLLNTVSSQSPSNILDRYQNLLKESPISEVDENAEIGVPLHTQDDEKPEIGARQQSLNCYLSRYEIIEAVNERADIKVHIRVIDSQRL